jgi:predicted regulator of Ras-like GTPase activity (Roadblock/LC7/MglB family)
MVASALVRQVLGTLRDVEGVHGSFVLSKAGDLLAKDLPAVFDDRLFATVGPRILRFYDALTAQGEELCQVVMRFTRHKLEVRPGVSGFVCVLCDANTNAAALRMAMALVARGLEPELGGMTHDAPATRPPELPTGIDELTPATPAPATQERSTLLSAASSTRAPITYRGRRLA